MEVGCNLNNKGIIQRYQCHSDNNNNNNNNNSCQENYFWNLLNKTDNTKLSDMCDVHNCKYVNGNNQEEKLKYDNIPEKYNIMNVNIETEYANLMKKSGESIYSKEEDVESEKGEIYDYEYKVCVPKKEEINPSGVLPASETQQFGLEDLESKLSGLREQKEEFKRNKSFYQVLFG